MNASVRAQSLNTTSGRSLGGLLRRFSRTPARASSKPVQPAQRTEPAANFGRHGITPTPVVFHVGNVPAPHEFTLTALRAVKQTLAKKDTRPTLDEVRRRVDAMFENAEFASTLPLF